MVVTYDLSGRTAVVAGGAGGIGRAIVERLRTSGARVWVFDLEPDSHDGTASLRVDLTRSEDVARAVAHVVQQASGIDILVNTAGYLGPYAPLEQVSEEVSRRIVEVNLLGVLELCRQVVPHMRRAGGGRIVNMGSLAGKQGLRNLAAYSAASAGVIAFTKALASELAETGIRANCVAPGPIATEMITRLGSAVVDDMIGASPLKRLGTVEEVAEQVVWLCSDAASFTTGAVFDVSGGRATY